MLKFGLETEACHFSFQNKRMDIFQFLDFAYEMGYDGVMINIIEKKNLQERLGALGKDDPTHIKRVAKKIKEYGMFAQIDTRGTDFEHLAHTLEIAEMLGADMVRTFVLAGAGYDHKNLVGEFDAGALQKAYDDLIKIIPLLEKYRIRLAIENHCVETMSEIMELVNKLDSPWIGVLFDICNTLPAWEDPMDAAEKCAGKIFAVHVRDEVICTNGVDNGLVITSTPIGKGNIDIKSVCNYVLDHTTLDRMVLEISFPFTTTFQRVPGTGGVTDVGQGAFEIKSPPFAIDKIKPNDYYLYEGELLDDFIERQLESVRSGLQYMKNFREEYMKNKSRLAAL